MADKNAMRPSVTPRVLRDFAGRWALSRRITQIAGPAARFDGIATWTATSDGLNYLETGTMTIENRGALQAERRYFWAEDLSVYFEDGRFFHRVPALGGAVQHWCDPDAYELIYDFTSWPGFCVDWRVKGPRKDYVARTEYSPAGA